MTRVTPDSPARKLRDELARICDAAEPGSVIHHLANGANLLSEANAGETIAAIWANSVDPWSTVALGMLDGELPDPSVVQLNGYIWWADAHDHNPRLPQLFGAAVLTARADGWDHGGPLAAAGTTLHLDPTGPLGRRLPVRLRPHQVFATDTPPNQGAIIDNPPPGWTITHQTLHDLTQGVTDTLHRHDTGQPAPTGPLHDHTDAHQTLDGRAIADLDDDDLTAVFNTVAHTIGGNLETLQPGTPGGLSLTTITFMGFLMTRAAGHMPLWAATCTPWEAATCGALGGIPGSEAELERHTDDWFGHLIAAGHRDLLVAFNDAVTTGRAGDRYDEHDDRTHMGAIITAHTDPVLNRPLPDTLLLIAGEGPSGIANDDERLVGLRMPYQESIRMPPGFADYLTTAAAAFTERFGRPPGPTDPVFWKVGPDGQPAPLDPDDIADITQGLGMGPADTAPIRDTDPAALSFGRTTTDRPPPRPAGKIGRNDPCPCGSGRKHKKCCGG